MESWCESWGLQKSWYKGAVLRLVWGLNKGLVLRLQVRITWRVSVEPTTKGHHSASQHFVQNLPETVGRTCDWWNYVVWMDDVTCKFLLHAVNKSRNSACFRTSSRSSRFFTDYMLVHCPLTIRDSQGTSISRRSSRNGSPPLCLSGAFL